MRHDPQDEIAGRFTGSQDRFAHTFGHLHLVADMFLALFALALGRVGRLWIVRIAHPIGVHVFFVLGPNGLQRQGWLNGQLFRGKARLPARFGGRWLGRAQGRIDLRFSGLAGHLRNACSHRFFFLGQEGRRSNADLKLLAQDSHQQLHLRTLHPLGLLLLLQPSQ